ncbi:DNA-binding response regulator [Actinophytocola xinjiangensis]|uniref:DNA-binding response regulator n=1 Tax=Actinophytocola xinjiangensis TaxID=485602 RepID=A0A7Z1AXC4_9PSEU|nr:response regulator transcription factor [Actinophytocola xinjiangensis]OLF08103.1 DNA-binding response regulator [Actinophytocola xinjiangensis]
MRLILAEDHVLLLESLRRMLVAEGHEVIASVRDADALLEAVDRDQPDVVVTDVRMPPSHSDEGIRAALEVRSRWPEVGLLVLSQYVEKRYTAELISSDAGRVGYLLKDRVAQVGDFLEALERVGAGGTAFDPEVVRGLVARTTHTDPLAKLTARERAVLEKMAEGRTNANVAQVLCISLSSVEKHVNSIFEKLMLVPQMGYSRRVLAILRYLGS